MLSDTSYPSTVYKIGMLPIFMHTTSTKSEFHEKERKLSPHGTKESQNNVCSYM